MTTQLALAVSGWMIGWFLLWRIPRLSPPAGAVEDYSVVIPARNEAHNIGELVAQVRGQTHPPGEIVVVDDDSSDGTAAAAEAAGASVIRSGALPDGWVGKNWACHQGARETTAPMMVFLDADVRLKADALGAVVSRAIRSGGLLSVIPFHTIRRPYEWFSLFFAAVSVMGVGLAAAVRLRTRGACGACIAISRDDYRTIGGHAAVAGEVVEDIALAENADRLGLPVDASGGRTMISYRMYATGWRALVEGWTKNIASGAGRVPAWRTAAIAVWIAGAGSAVLALASAPLVGLALLAAWVFQLARMGTRLGTFPPRAALTYPLLLAGFVLIFARSLALVLLRRPVQWRGRAVPGRTALVGGQG